MHGPDRLGEAVSAVFRAPLWPLLGDRRYGIYDITHPEAAGVLLPAGPRRPVAVRHRLGARRAGRRRLTEPSGSPS